MVCQNNLTSTDRKAVVTLLMFVNFMHLKVKKFDILSVCQDNRISLKNLPPFLGFLLGYVFAVSTKGSGGGRSVLN